MNTSREREPLARPKAAAHRPPPHAEADGHAGSGPGGTAGPPESASRSTEPRRADDHRDCAAFHADPAKIARVRRRLVDERAGAALADTFKVLGDLTRVRLLHALAQAELCVCDLAALVGLSESAVSHQLRLLRSMRVVRTRREGRMVFYALDDEHVIGLFEQGLRHVEESAAATRAPAVRRAVEAARHAAVANGSSESRKAPRTRVAK